MFADSRRKMLWMRRTAARRVSLLFLSLVCSSGIVLASAARHRYLSLFPVRFVLVEKTFGKQFLQLLSGRWAGIVVTRSSYLFAAVFGPSAVVTASPPHDRS